MFFTRVFPSLLEGFVHDGPGSLKSAADEKPDAGDVEAGETYLI